MTKDSNAPAGNPRLLTVRIEVGTDARSYVSGQQRVTLVPLTIKRRQNRKLLIPPTAGEDARASGGLDVPMIKTLGKAFYWRRLLDGMGVDVDQAIAQYQSRSRCYGGRGLSVRTSGAGGRGRARIIHCSKFSGLTVC